MGNGWGRVGVVAAATVVAAGVTAGGYWLGWESVSADPPGADAAAAEPTGSPGSGAGSNTPTAPQTLTAPPTDQELEPLATPAPVNDVALEVAESWVRARLASTWQDPTPAAWVDKVRPLVTDDFAASLADSASGVSADAPAWLNFVAQGCTANAVNLTGGVPPEAPKETGLRYVEISADVQTNCQKGTPPPTWSYGARLEVSQTGETTWLVSNQLV